MVKVKYPVLLLFLILSACALIKKQPVASTLFALKIQYETIMEETVRAYQSGELSREQTIEIARNGERFVEKYNIVRSLYLVTTSEITIEQIEELTNLLNDLQALFKKHLTDNKL